MGFPILPFVWDYRSPKSVARLRLADWHALTPDTGRIRLLVETAKAWIIMVLVPSPTLCSVGRPSPPEASEGILWGRGRCPTA